MQHAQIVRDHVGYVALESSAKNPSADLRRASRFAAARPAWLRSFSTAALGSRRPARVRVVGVTRSVPQCGTTASRHARCRTLKARVALRTATTRPNDGRVCRSCVLVDGNSASARRKSSPGPCRITIERWCSGRRRTERKPAQNVFPLTNGGAVKPRQPRSWYTPSESGHQSRASRRQRSAARARRPRDRPRYKSRRWTPSHSAAAGLAGRRSFRHPAISPADSLFQRDAWRQGWPSSRDALTGLRVVAQGNARGHLAGLRRHAGDARRAVAADGNARGRRMRRRTMARRTWWTACSPMRSRATCSATWASTRATRARRPGCRSGGGVDWRRRRRRGSCWSSAETPWRVILNQALAPSLSRALARHPELSPGASSRVEPCLRVILGSRSVAIGDRRIRSSSQFVPALALKRSFRRSAPQDDDRGLRMTTGPAPSG